MIRGLTIILFWGLEYTVIPDQDLSVLWSKIDLIVRHVSYFKFDSRAIKPHFHGTLGFFFRNRSICCSCVGALHPILDVH